MATKTIEDIEVSAGTDGSAVNDFMEQYGREEPDGPFLPGDTFSTPGLKEKPGLKFIEAKAEEMPSYRDRDEEVYEDLDCQMTVSINGELSKYGTDENSKSMLLEDVKNWLIAGNENSLKVLKQEIVNSTATFQQVDSTIILDSYARGGFIGDVQDSLFYKNFWDKHMKQLIVEGVCYMKGKVPDDLIKRLRTHIDEVAKKTTADFHPKSNDIVRDLVHPALYPFIKEISKVKKDAKLPTEPTEEEAKDFWGRAYEDSKFQWLPTPFKITSERKCKIQEYINNLDQSVFPALYQDLEHLFEIFLPYFEEVWSYSKAVKFFDGEDDDDDSENGEIPPLAKEAVSFTGQELQIIVKIVEYRLQTDQAYEGVWHAEGMSHENIVMTGDDKLAWI